MLDLSSWREQLDTLGNCSKYTIAYLPQVTEGHRYVNLYNVQCLCCALYLHNIMMDEWKVPPVDFMPVLVT